jgi:asparagine synthase (glutamine-hydrolysing)
MCGIYGKVGFDRKVDASECLKRTQMLNHRGPDYCGSYSNERIFLGHARLSILDLTPAGNQPFGDEEAQLVFNGEIYNWQELFSKHLAGQVLHSHSDTEVLFLLLRKLGTACLPLLNGMFSFAYYTVSTQNMILARDMVGIKPLNFVSGASYFEFSSEIKNIDYETDLNRLKEYLYFGRFGEDFLPYSNVNEVLPGSYIDLDCVTGKWVQKPYREVESLVSQERYTQLASSGNLVDQLDSLLTRSISMHEQSDAPIGFLCSGGLDSSLITAIAAKSHPNIALYHADFEGEGRELDFAEQVARHVGAPLRKTTLTKVEFWQLFPEMTYSLDLPLQHPHSISLNMIAGKARADGVKVLLAGDGADELFMGYDFYSSYSNSLSNYRHQFDPRKLVRMIMNSIRRGLNSASDPHWFFSEINRGFQKHAHVGFGGDACSLANPLQAMSLVSQDFKAWKRWQQATESYAWMGEGREASVLSFQLFYMRYFLQPLLHRLDRMLMNPSVEGRVPFLENELIQFALNLPVIQKIQGTNGKHLLKQVALRYLPSDIVNRKKKGFTVPFKQYVTKYPKILEDGFVSDWTRFTKKELVSWCNGDIDFLYRLISIEVWGRIFVHKTPWSNINIDA